MSKKNDPKSASEIQSQQWLEQLLLEEKKINSQQKSKTDAPPKAVLSTLHCCSHAGDLWKDASELRVLILHFQDQSSVSKPNGEDRCLPLHLAVKYHAPLKVIKLIQSLYPEAAKRKDDKGRLPLHYAALNHYQEAVSFLLSVYPEGAEVTEESEGRTPLELAFLASAGDEINRSQRVTRELLSRVQSLADPEKTKIHYELETGLSLHAPWMRSRITVVGDGGVGKTSTIRHLFQGRPMPRPKNRDRTNLIRERTDLRLGKGRRIMAIIHLKNLASLLCIHRRIAVYRLVVFQAFVLFQGSSEHVAIECHVSSVSSSVRTYNLPSRHNTLYL